MSEVDELNSYSVSNFISFMDEVYLRLFERQYEAYWPGHLVLLAIGIGILVFSLMGKFRVVSIASAIPLTVCAVTFHFELYAELTPVGKFFGWAFLLQAFFFLIWGAATKSPKSKLLSVHAIIGTAITIFAIVGYPLLTQLEERTWKGAEYFGMAPDPTVCFLFGISLLCARPLWFLLLLPIPLLWSATTYGTLDVLELSYPLTLPIVATITVAAGIWKAIFDRVSPESDVSNAS